MATSEPVEPPVDESAPEFYDEPWVTPPFQPVRAICALILIASGFGLYEYVLVSFWSVPWMGIHDRIPWPAFALLAAAIVLSIAGLRFALGLASPHGKLGFGLFAFLACIVVGAGGGRFVSYVMRATLNPPFTLKLAVGQQFPSFALTDQNDSLHHGPVTTDAGATLIYVYRGDYDAFARFELAELTAHAEDFSHAGVDILAVSTDQVERSKMLAGFLRTKIPLLSDTGESLVAPLGLVQHHRNGEPDNAIPAFFILDRNGVVRWIFTSPYYRELPRADTLLDAAKS
ncbi:redoxin domain-containing protein, partial [Candidatus Binatus sp.]|uniref:redoxin domain-containing protein n=1 Tax=Candidatus Binatus sp. TaxID=2811406 RepID=UPI003C729876